MIVKSTGLAEVLELVPNRYHDSRGWLSETANQRSLQGAGIDLAWLQDNESLSTQSGTLRGIHYQRSPHAQHKLVRAISGSIFDVAVDLRRSSSTFGQYVAVTLTAEEGNQLFVPAGFGHGFCTLEPDCRVAYKVAGSFYTPSADAGVRWNDPDIGIEWPVDQPFISEKDQTLPLLRDAESTSDS